jgi:hypothetical protein
MLLAVPLLEVLVPAADHENHSTGGIELARRIAVTGAATAEPSNDVMAILQPQAHALGAKLPAGTHYDLSCNTAGVVQKLHWRATSLLWQHTPTLLLGRAFYHSCSW